MSATGDAPVFTGVGGRMTKNTYIGKLEENPGAIPGSFPEEVGEVR